MVSNLGLSFDKVTMGTTSQNARIVAHCCYDTKIDGVWARILSLRHPDGPSCRITDGVFHVTSANPGWAIGSDSFRV